MKEIDCIIGTDHEGKPAVLIAPFHSLVRVGDVVGTKDKLYTVRFVDPFHTLDDELMTGLFCYTGEAPEKLYRRVEEVSFDWGECDVDG